MASIGTAMSRDAGIAASMIDILPRLRRYARTLARNRVDADDLVQDTCERAWMRVDTLRSSSDLRAWLFGIMHNLYVDQHRRKSVTIVHGDVVDLADWSADRTFSQLQVTDLHRALDRLPSEQLDVLLLVVLEDMTYDEVSTTLHIPIGTVMSRLSRARARLLELLEGDQQGSCQPARVMAGLQQQLDQK
jgi:RNA polymerase sigma factor (sigma-70 family)